MAFAIRVVRLYKYLTEKKKEFVLSKQLLRSGTSIGANRAEAQYACSEKDFLQKNTIALKECAEAIFWLDLLHATDYLTSKQFTSMKADCEELLRMLVAATRTLKGNKASR
ncbi:MAG: four helix bundle protein [Kiritimatiellaeota bacterium]|nr:four helix bundle protein [Kiritimatiellota bacterium]